VPIEEIHFGGTREPWGRDAWSVWSVESKPTPGPGPAWEGLDLNMDIYGEEIERFAAEATTDGAFEAARDAALRAARG
jgi:hypothetical protein